MTYVLECPYDRMTPAKRDKTPNFTMETKPLIGIGCDKENPGCVYKDNKPCCANCDKMMSCNVSCQLKEIIGEIPLALCQDVMICSGRNADAVLKDELSRRGFEIINKKEKASLERGKIELDKQKEELAVQQKALKDLLKMVKE
jgi:hypothetical protein